MKIHIDNHVLRDIGIHQGEKGYSTFSTVVTSELIVSMQKHATSPVKQKIEYINVASLQTESLPIYGLGDGHFLIGYDATKRNEDEKQAVRNFQEDEVDPELLKDGE